MNALTGAGAGSLTGPGEALHCLTGAGHSAHGQPRHHGVLEGRVVGEAQSIVQSWLGGGHRRGGSGCSAATAWERREQNWRVDVGRWRLEY